MPPAAAKAATLTPTGKQQATPSPGEATGCPGDTDTSEAALNTTLEALRSTGCRVTRTAERPDLRLRSTVEPGAAADARARSRRRSTASPACSKGSPWPSCARFGRGAAQPPASARSTRARMRLTISRRSWATRPGCQTATSGSGECGRLGRSDVDRHRAVRSPNVRLRCLWTDFPQWIIGSTKCVGRWRRGPQRGDRRKERMPWLACQATSRSPTVIHRS